VTAQAGKTLKERRTSREDFRLTWVFRNGRGAKDLRVEPLRGANDEEGAFNRYDATPRGDNTLQKPRDSTRGTRRLVTGGFELTQR